MENRYDKYKDSGIEWIGEIPVHWEICKLKNIFCLSTGTTPKDFDKISEGDSLINWYTPSDILDSCNDLFSAQRKLSEKVIYENKLSLFPIGTLLYVGIGASAGKVGYANECGYSNQQITGLIPLKCYSRFYFYYLSVLKDKIRDNAFFTTLPIINNVYLGQELIPFPYFSEQQSIVTYLDQKCGEIDELIALQKEMITKLQSYKQSVITEAVTKGLDKNAPLKDSGIEWIGEIPEHWSLVSIGKLFNIYAGGDAKPDYYSDTKDLEHPFPVYTNTKSEHEIYAYTSKAIFPANTITVTGRGDVGHAIYRRIPYDAIIRLLSLIPKNNYDCRFYTYFIDIVIPFMDGKSAVAQLSALQLKPQIVCLPSNEEQQAIADYLDQKCGEIDKLISIKQQKIEKLKDYKKSLIFECVTGKRKVC